ncbi:MAG: methyltransferase [Spirochaetaceae bacterium]|nr:methyltransferase [Spirochaetaceae bacterium]MCF7949584.1 methyltransferase [Spirochaetia bacterium]MCF7952362.1 methyltransferase [Spirochaetaceae bacterium]
MMESLISHYSNKEVSLRCAEGDLSFILSQALFSSYEIDKGSRFLLKTAQQNIDFSSIQQVLDIGCGIGTLGISLQSCYPHLQITMQDRDALALAFSQYNAQKNSTEGVCVVGGLAFQGLQERHFDLVISNIPAKVGEPVLRQLYSSMLFQGTLSAIVVVNPLADYTQQTLAELGARILYQEQSSGHSVFYFTPEQSAPPSEEKLPAAELSAEELPPAYFRTSASFEYADLSYCLDTVWGLADFDSIPFQTQSVYHCVKSAVPFNRVCIWNPGQGHTAALLAAAQPKHSLTIDLLGRDMLALQASRHNLRAQPHVNIGHLLHSPTPVIAAEKLNNKPNPQAPDLLIIELEHLADVPSAQEVLTAAGMLLEPEGILLITGKSAHIQQFARSPEGFHSVATKKHKGYRCVALKRD